MFTPYERRQLQIIEEWFERDDPELARTLRSGPVKRRSTLPQMISASVAGALGVLGVITGTFMLLFGAAVATVVAAWLINTRREKD